jgi:iron complex outermembrane recepter protein
MPRMSKARMSLNKFLSSTSIAIALVYYPAVVVQAQDRGDVELVADSGQVNIIEEIVVTATKRETTLQSTPIAVSVVGQDAIEKARILDIRELGSIVPSLRVNQLQNSVNTNFIIRGFGNGANNAGIEPSVGVFIDGVYRSRSASRIVDLPKLSRVEVLRGPQSTLFGKNASAGVISIVTAKPSFENEGYVEAGYGTFNNTTGKAYFTGPLSDSVAFSVGGGFNKRDGYVKTLPGIDPLNDRDRWNVRGQMLFDPGMDTTVRIIADYSELDENCCAITNIQNQGAANAILALGGQIADANNPFAREAFQNKNSVNTVTDYGLSLHVDHSFEKVQLTSISAYRNTDSFQDTDVDFSSLPLLDGTQDRVRLNTFTQELRLASTGVNTVDWMLGGFLFTEEVSQVSGLQYGSSLRPFFDIAIGDPTVLAGFEGLYGFAPGSFFGDQVETVETFTQNGTAFSIFGSTDIHVTDRITISGGLNYTRDKKTVTARTTNNDDFSNIDLTNQLTAFGVPLPTILFGTTFTTLTGLAPTPSNIAAVEAGAPGTSAAIAAGVAAGITDLEALQFQPQFLAFPNAIEDGRSNDDKVTWSIRAAYEANEYINVYASVATGFKSTSWNLSRDSRPLLANGAALGAAGLLPANFIIGSGRNFGTRLAGPEKATVIEFGVKARFEYGAINLAVFDQSIKGFQSNTFLGTGFGLTNAGEQSTQGIEVDATYVPVESLVLNFAGTFLDPIYDSFEGGINGTSLTGTKPSGIPSTAISVSATYNHDFDNGLAGFVRGDWQYESRVQTNEGFSQVIGAEQPFRRISSFNFSIGLDTGKGISILLWGRNVFDNTYLTTVFPGVAQTGVVNGYLNTPAMFGASLRATF